MILLHFRTKIKTINFSVEWKERFFGETIELEVTALAVHLLSLQPGVRKEICGKEEMLAE